MPRIWVYGARRLGGSAPPVVHPRIWPFGARRLGGAPGVPLGPRPPIWVYGARRLGGQPSTPVVVHPPTWVYGARRLGGTFVRPQVPTLPLSWLPFFSGPSRQAALPYDIADAVIAWVRTQVPSGTLPGGQHYGWAGETADGSPRQLPYIDVIRVYETHDHQANRIYIASGMLQVSVFGKSRLGTAMAADIVAASLSDPVLLFQRGSLMYFRQSNMRGGKDPDPGPSGLVVYQEMRMFNYTYNYTL